MATAPHTDPSARPGRRGRPSARRAEPRGRSRRLTSDGWPLVGRDRESAWLVDSMPPQARRGAIIAGPPGTGKTRILDDVVLPVLNGADSLRVLRLYGSHDSKTEPLAAVAPWLPTELTNRGLHADALRAAAASLVADANGSDIAIVIDDAHLLDDASALVVLNMVLAGDAVAFATITTGEATPDPMIALWKDAGATRIDLGPLGTDAIDRLLTAVLAGPVDAAAVRDIAAATEGNPMLLRELVLGALADGTLAKRDRVWGTTGPLHATPRLAQRIDDHLADLSDDQRDVVERLAVGGSLEPCMLGPSATSSVLPELERRAIIEADFDGRRWLVALRHPLAAGVVRERMTASRRREVNRALADEWERGHCGSPDGGSAEEIVRASLWRLDGGGQVDPARIVEAARHAMFELELEPAERLARAALDLGDAAERTAAGILLAEILGLIGRHDEAHDLLLDLAASAADDQARAMIGIARGSALFFGLGHHGDAIAVLRSTEDGLPAGSWADEVRATRAHIEMLAGFPDRALALAEDLINRDLVSDADRRVFVTAALATECALAISGRCDEAVELCARAERVHEQLGRQQTLARSWIHEATMALAHCEGGRPDRAEAIAIAGHDAAIERRDRAGQAWFALVAGRAILAQGRPRSARAYLNESSALFGELGQTGPRRWALSGAVIASALLDDSDAMNEAHGMLADLQSPFGMMESDVRRADAWHAHHAGDAGRARSIAECALQHALEVGAVTLAAPLAWDLARFGGFEPAAIALGSIAEEHGNLDARLLADVAIAMDRRDADVLDVLSSACEARGLLLEAAEAAASSAELGTGRSSFGAARRASELRERCDGAVTPLLAGANRAEQLTERQLEVARLAAEGLPSKTIAQRLFVSARTVDNNLQQAFRKLGISSRRELVAFFPPTTHPDHRMLTSTHSAA